MGKRVSEQSAKKMRTNRILSLFLPPEISYKPPSLPTGFHYPLNCGYTDDCGYGYMVNISHPYIEPFYSAYKEWLRTAFPLSDNERLLFEADMIYCVFRMEYEKSLIYSKLDLDRCAERIIKNRERYSDWVKFRTERFGKREEAG